jgi:hypothetical protein
MTINEATEILYDAASRQGIAMNRDECEFIARKILMATAMVDLSMKPGDIAHYHRTRYEHGEPEASHADQEDQEDLSLHGKRQGS